MKKINWYEVILYVGVTLTFVGFTLGYFACLDQLDRYTETATVIKVEPLDEQEVMFETESGNIFVECFDYEYEIKPQSKAILTIKDYEDGDVENDRVVKVKWVE